MRPLPLALASALALPLGGCGALMAPMMMGAMADAGGTVEVGVACPATAFASLVGQPASVVDAIPPGAVAIRVLRAGEAPGPAVPSRVTLRADAGGIITGAACG